jgi:hypothetical protein
VGADLTLADGRALAVARLLTSSAMTSALGGADRVYGGDRPRPPYPMLRVGAGTTDNRTLTWLLDDGIVLEAWGDLDGQPGAAELRRILYVAIGVLRDLPDEPAVPGWPVISRAAFPTASYVPGPGGQPRYLAAGTLTVHPPNH